MSRKGRSGIGTKYGAAQMTVDEYSVSQKTDSKQKIVSFYRDIDKTGGVRFDAEAQKIKITQAVRDKVTSLADELAGRISYQDRNARRDYQDIRQLLANGVTIAKQDRNDIPDFSQYVRSSANMVRITRQGMGIDSAYQELASMYPQYFNAEKVTAPSDQLQDINRVLGQLKNSSYKLSDSERATASRYLQDEIINGYVRVMFARNRRRAS